MDKYELAQAVCNMQTDIRMLKTRISDLEEKKNTLEGRCEELEARLEGKVIKVNLSENKEFLDQIKKIEDVILELNRVTNIAINNAVKELSQLDKMAGKTTIESQFKV